MDGGKMVLIVPEDVQKEIENIMHDRFDMAKEPVLGEDSFFGLGGLLKPRELTYLAYMLEQRYSIRFGMEEYDNPKFYNLTGLSEIVAGMVTEKGKAVI